MKNLQQNNLSPALVRFLELERKKDDVKKYFEELKLATEAVATEIGIGGMFQDPSDGTVFKVVVPEGRFVAFDKISYVRTRRAHEQRGDLSLKEAEAAGFSVPTKK
jgi:hypothetical protein